MAGGIPSGSNPSGWEAGTVGSNPAQGYDPTAAAGAVVGTGTDSGLSGLAAGISNMISRTQDTITAAYQSTVQNDPTLTGYSDQVFAGLNPDGTTPLSTLIIQALGAAFGVPQDQLTTTEASLTAIGNTFTALGGNITTATNNFNTLLTSLGQADAAALGTFLTAVANNASGASGDWATLLATLSQADSAAFAAYVSAANANALAAQTNWTTLFGEFGWTGAAATTFAAWLSGAASGSMATNVSASAITSANAQMLVNPNFSGAISVVGNSIWSWDGAVYYVPPGQTVTSPGSALVTANGALQGLTSDASSEFPLGQPVVYSVQVLTQGLTGSGTLLELYAIPWIGTVAQTPVLIAESGAPTGATTGWTNPPTGSKATTLFGSYTPLTTSGITSVSMQLIVTGSALSGTVRFSAASEELTGGLIADLQDEFAASQTASATLWTAWSAATAEIVGGNWSGGIAAAESAYSTYQTAMAGIESAEYVTIEELLSTVGINFGTGFMSAGNVSSVLSGSSLGADVSGVSTATTNNNTWLGQWLTYARILEDIFHGTYPAGSPTDTPTTTVGGLPTWYSAWNGILILEGLVKGTTAPTTPAPTTGAAITAAAAAATTAGTNASIAISSASAANTLAQGSIDGIYQASNGGVSTGNPVTTVVTSLTAQPASNIIGIAPAAVAFGALGGTSSGPASSSPVTVTESHGPASGDTGVIIAVGFDYGDISGGSMPVPSATASFGGVAATLLGTSTCPLTAFTLGSTVQFWWLKDATGWTGAQTVSATVTPNSGQTVYDVWVASESMNAAAVGTPTTISNTGTALSMTGSSATGHRMVGAFVLNNYSAGGNPTLSAFSQTSRYAGAGASTAEGTGAYFLFGDAAGASSLTFSATCSKSSRWAGILVDLHN